MQQDIKKILDKIKEDFPRVKKELIDGLKKEGMTEEEIGPVEQTIDPAEPVKNGIPTFKKGVYKKLPPMLEERFKYAGSWQIIDEIWLGLSDMEKQLSNKNVQATFKAQKENWDGSAPMSFPPERLSLFAVTEGVDGDQAYLVWPEQEGEEPEVWKYADQNETKYKSLQKYFEHVAK